MVSGQKEDAATNTNSAEVNSSKTPLEVCTERCSIACGKIEECTQELCTKICSVFDPTAGIQVACDEKENCWILGDQAAGTSDQPIMLPVITCVEKTDKVCKDVDQNKCDAAYKKLDAYILKQCGDDDGTDVWEKCRANAKAKLIIPACTPSCKAAVTDVYSATLKDQLTAASTDEALQKLLDSLLLPVCTAEPAPVVEDPASTPAPDPTPVPVTTAPDPAPVTDPTPAVLSGVGVGIAPAWFMTLNSGTGFGVWEIYSDGSTQPIIGRDDVLMIIDDTSILYDQVLNVGNPQINAIGIGKTIVRIIYKGFETDVPVAVTQQ